MRGQNDIICMYMERAAHNSPRKGFLCSIRTSYIRTHEREREREKERERESERARERERESAREGAREGEAHA
jgi:hypothetical protein